MRCKELFLTLMILLGIISCSNNSSNSNRSKEIVVNVSSEPKTLDPTISGGDFVYPRHVFETLTIKNKEGKLVGGAAESWDISTDGLVYTFHLRTNAKWSDGVDVKASDFVYALQRAVDPNTAAEYTIFVEYIKNANKILSGKASVDSLAVKAIDDYTLEITLEAPTGYFLDILTYPVYAPVRKDIIEKYGVAWSLNPETYIGNGSFIMTERSQDEKIVLVKNTNYWNRDNIIPEKITFLLFSDPNLALAGIKDGSLDFSVNVLEQDMVKLKDEGLLKVLPYFSTFAFGINATNDTLKDIRVRKALSLAIDRNYIVENVVPTATRATSAWVAFGTSDVSGDFRENGGEYIDISKGAYSKNVEEAKRLLAEAGYPDGKGFPILEYKTPNGLINIQVAEAVQSMWKENLGIDLKIVPLDSATFQQDRIDKNYQLVRNLWTGDYNDPVTFLENYVSGRVQNTIGYSNSEFDKYFKIATTSADNTVRMEAMHNAERILIEEDNILIPIYNPSNPVLVNKRFKGYLVTPLLELNFNYAYLE